MLNRRYPMNYQAQAANIQSRYPEVYNGMMPHVQGIVNGMGPRRNFSRADLRRHSMCVAQNCGYYDDPPYGLNRRAISDIAALLILSYLL